MKNVQQFILPDGLEINVFYQKGKLAYNFTHNGQSYGNAIRLEKKDIESIVGASLLLFTNAIETKKALN